MPPSIPSHCNDHGLIPFLGTIRDPRVYVDVCKGQFTGDEELIAVATQNAVEIYRLAGSALVHNATIHMQQTITAIKKLNLCCKTKGQFRDALIATTVEGKLMMIVYSTKLKEYFSYIALAYDKIPGISTDSRPIGHRIFIGDSSVDRKDGLVVLQVIESRLIIMEQAGLTRDAVKVLDKGGLRFDARSVFRKPFISFHGRFSPNDEIEIVISPQHEGESPVLALITISQISPSAFFLREKSHHLDQTKSTTSWAYLESNRRDDEIFDSLLETGPAKIQVMRNHSRWILGAFECIHYNVKGDICNSRQKHRKVIPTPIRNAQILVTVELHDEICLAITSEDTAFWVCATGGQLASGVIQLTTHDMYPTKAMMVAENKLLVTGRSQCILYHVSGTMFELRIQPVLSFSGIGPIVDMIAKKNNASSKDQLELVCCTSSGSLGGTVSMLSSNVVCDIDKHADTYNGVIRDIWSLEIDSNWYIMVSYMDGNVRSFSVVLDSENVKSLAVPSGKHLREKDCLNYHETKETIEEVFSASNHDILDLSELPGILLVVAQGGPQESVIIAVTDQVIMIQNGMNNSTRRLLELPRKDKIVKIYKIALDSAKESEKRSSLVFEYENFLEFYRFSDNFSEPWRRFRLPSDMAGNSCLSPLIQAFYLKNCLCLLVAPAEGSIQILVSPFKGSLKGKWRSCCSFPHNPKRKLITSVIMKEFINDKIEVFIGNQDGWIEYWTVPYSLLTTTANTVQWASPRKSFLGGSRAMKLYEIAGNVVVGSSDTLLIADESRNFRAVKTDFFMGDSVLATSYKRQAVIAASRDFFRVVHLPQRVQQAQVTSTALRQTPYAIAELTDGSIITLNRHAIVEDQEKKAVSDKKAIVTAYGVYVLDTNLKVKHRTRLRQDFEPFALTALPSGGFLIGGQKNSHARLGEVERKMWKNMHPKYVKALKTHMERSPKVITRKSENAVKSIKSIEMTNLYIDTRELAIQAKWQERVIGLVQSFVKTGKKTYTLDKQHTRYGGPVLTINTDKNSVMVTIGSKFQVVDEKEVTSVRGNDYWKKAPTYEKTLQTQTLCVASDMSQGRLAMGDATRGVILIDLNAKKPHAQYSAYFDTTSITALKLISSYSDGNDSANVIVSDDSGMIRVLADKQSSSSETNPVKRLHLYGKFKLNEKINKILLNDGKVWNSIAFKSYETVFTPVAVLAGCEGGLYQFGWINSKKLDEEMMAGIEMLRNLQYNMLCTYYCMEGERMADEKYLQPPFDQDGKRRAVAVTKDEHADYCKRVKSLDFSKRMMDSELLRMYLKLDEKSQTMIAEGDENSYLKTCGTRNDVIDVIYRLLQTVE